MAKKKAKKSKSNQKKKSSGNIFTKIIVIVFALILIGFIAFSYVPKISFNKKQTQNASLVKKEKKVVKEETPNDVPEQKTVVERSIEGCWMSTTGGAVLTMKNFEYRIDFMGVDSGKPHIGSYSVDNETITFINGQEPCKGEKGVYKVEFDKKEISFECESDGCTKRKATLVTDWEWLEE